MTDYLTTAMDPSARATIFGAAVGFMALEYGLSRLAQIEDETHDLRETAASFGVALGQKAVKLAEAGIVALPFALLYEHRILTIDATTPLGMAAVFLAVEFVYYWHHRASHRIRWMWATHSVHHSPTKLNFTSAIRLGWTGTISGNFLFFAPLALIGFHPIAILATLGLNLLYQFFIHTELAPKLGPLEWVLNTPTHHRVHHASNESCLDRNYGGVLIVFDRLFGTFAAPPEGERLRYGLKNGTPTLNPLKIALGEWTAMFRDVGRARSARGRFRSLFAPPGSEIEPAQAAEPQRALPAPEGERA